MNSFTLSLGITLLSSYPHRLRMENGVAKTSVLKGASGSPNNFSGVQEGLGVDLYSRVINGQGGIHGRKFKHINYDGQDKRDFVLENTKVMVERDKILAILVDGGTANFCPFYPSRKSLIIS